MAKRLPADFDPAFAQDANVFTFNKGSFPTLTASVNNSIQNLLVALLLKALSVFTPSYRTNNPDETLVLLNDGFTFRTEGVNTFRVTTVRVQLFSLVPNTEIDPDDY